MTSVSPEATTMRIKTRISDRKVFSQLDRCLVEANKKYLVSCNKRDLHETKTIVEQVINKIVAAMIKQSPTFSKLHYKIFGVGSSYEQTKVGKPDEFDIDIVLKIPDVLKPVLQCGELGGFAHLQLENFDILSKIDPDMHRTLKEFVDEEKFILSEEMMFFIQKLFNAAKSNFFPDGIIEIGTRKYKITKVEYVEPALTLKIEGLEFSVSVDLVASFLLSKNFWPQYNVRRSPFSQSQNDFFLAPARPVETHPHRRRFWRMSFHIQEKQILFNRYRLKPAMRVIKRICGHLNQTIYSYVIKTLFLWELNHENPSLGLDTPPFWKSSLSYIVFYMMEKYLQCLTQSTISHFWDARFNLLSYLSQQEIEQYRNQIDALLEDIKQNPHPEVLLKYLK